MFLAHLLELALLCFRPCGDPVGVDITVFCEGKGLVPVWLWSASLFVSRLGVAFGVCCGELIGVSCPPPCSVVLSLGGGSMDRSRTPPGHARPLPFPGPFTGLEFWLVEFVDDLPT